MTGPRLSRGPRVPLEKTVQSHGVTLLRSLGAQVYVLGTRRRSDDYPGTMMTAGLPDVWAFLPRPVLTSPVLGTHPLRFLWWEAKRPGATRRPEQCEFGRWCEAAGTPYVWGDLDALIAWLTAGGWLKPDTLPAYRQPKGSI
jgi:hypothetical protein